MPILKSIVFSIFWPVALAATDAGLRLQALNETPLLMAGSGRVTYLDVSGREVWSVGGCGNVHQAELRDGWVYYSNGDLWRVRPDGRDRSLVYRPCATDGLFGFEFQPDGNLVIAENGTSDVVELAAGTTNAIVRFRADPRCPDGTMPGRHVRFRMVHKTATGTYLVCCSTARTLREYDAKGALVWEQTCGALVFDAVRRANGNTLISHYDGISEFTPDHKVVWNFPAAAELTNFCGLRELPNGDLLVGTYARGKPDGSVTTAFRLTRDKRIVWRLGGSDRNRMCVTPVVRPAGGGLVGFDFERGDLQGWKVITGSFARPVSDRAAEHRSGRPYTKGGKWFLSTLEMPDGRPYDGQTGTIESPLVRLAAPDVSFRIGGGKGGVAFELVDRKTKKVLASATGDNSEAMQVKSWHVPDAVGKDVYFRVTDGSIGGWGHLTLDDVRFSGTVGAGDFMARQIEQAGGRLDAAEKAVCELGRRFPGYPLAKHRETIAVFRRDGATPDRLDAFLLQALVRDNPIVNANEIAYVTHAQYAADHHNTATVFQHGEINEGSYRTEGALKALDPKTGATRTIVPLEKGRTVRDPEVDYDGRRIVFSMRRGRDDDYHVYTVWSDGSALRQLTREKGVSDIDPVWLPDGDIVFSSTRNPKYCMCNRHIMANLYRMRPNGANVHQIGVSTLFEGHSTVLPDGRVLYDRWEYVDRNFGDAQGLWVCNPDGTRHAVYWGNNTTSPGGVINARHLPDGRVIAVLGSCHDRPWGALGIIDRTKGVDGQKPVDVTWPREYRGMIHDGGREDFDSSKIVKMKYADPFPLDEGHFLATRQTERGEEMALVYLDLFGNEVVVHAEAPGVHSPVVLRPSPRPKVPATQRTFAGPNAPGRFLLQDVYVGTHMKGVKRGTVKALRIVESPEKRNWTRPQGWFGHGEMAPAMNWHSFENKRVLGTVPVEEDGSAYFELPANTFVYFQALDAEGKMVQSMRSGAYVQPGEIYGCVGCHENRTVQAPPPAAPTMASRRAPSKLDGSYNLRGLERGAPPHLYSFRREVQPVFDRSCVKCHDYGKEAGEKLNLSGDLGAYFCTSYVDLWARGAIKCVGGGPAEIQPAYSWGSHASKLTKKLYGHSGVTLSDDDRDRVLAWMDLNAPYYPQYESAYPENPGGRMPLTVQERDRLQVLSGMKISGGYWPRQREQLDFTRPECSRLLSASAFATNSEGRAEALAIIVTGRDRLAKTPRCDMEGFVPCETDCRREERYQRRLVVERNVYKAISEGREVFDKEEVEEK